MRRPGGIGFRSPAGPSSKLKTALIVIIVFIIIVLSSSVYYVFLRTSPNNNNNNDNNHIKNNNKLPSSLSSFRKTNIDNHKGNKDAATTTDDDDEENTNNNNAGDDSLADIPPDQREAKNAQFDDPKDQRVLLPHRDDKKLFGFDNPNNNAVVRGPPSKVCALVLDTRSFKRFRDDDTTTKSTTTEDEEIFETVKTTFETLNEFHKKFNSAIPQYAPEILLFSPFLDQPDEFPVEIKTLQKSNNNQTFPTTISKLELSIAQLDKILVFDEDAHFDAIQREKLKESNVILKNNINNNENGNNNDDASHPQNHKSTFIEAIERILLAIEASKIDPRHKCQSLLLVNGVFSANTDVHQRLSKAMQGLLTHPSSRTTRSQLENAQSFILSPLIISGNAKTHSTNIFSFGNEVVELFEGLPWAVPRFYGFPIHYAPASEEASYVNSPTGALVFFTPACFQVIEKVIDEQFLSHRYRLGREWIEKARGNYVVVNSNEENNNNNNNNANIGSDENKNNNKKKNNKQRNPNGIAEVDPVVPGGGGAVHSKNEEKIVVIENHLLACDAALAELAATAVKHFNMYSLAVRNGVPPVVFHEETPNTLSTRYMKVIAQAATGLGQIQMGRSSSSNNNNNNNRKFNTHYSPNIPHDQPHKVASLPAAWVIKALPFVTSIASDLWFRFVGGQYLPNTTIFWDPYCGCTGINIEAINFLVPLERFVRTRAVAAPDCWCPGFPVSDQFALRRMQAGKLLNKGSTSKFHVWISHKPVDAFPSFPYDGAITYDKKWEKGEISIEESANYQQNDASPSSRPDLVIGRTMIESDRISQDWVRRLNDKNSPSRVDELWVPSTFLVDAFRKSGVREDLPIVVVPEGIDPHFYDPQFAVPHPKLDRTKICPTSQEMNNNNNNNNNNSSSRPCFVFLSNFKWEYRKGWDILLKSYFTTFSNRDNVVLVLKTYLYMDPDPKNPERIRNKIHEWVRREPSLRHHFHHNNQQQQGGGKQTTTLPKFVIISEDLPSFHMPNLYRAVDCFVLPTRGEGWGLPLQEAMTMGLVTIGTNFGGNLDFMPRFRNKETHFLINVSKMEVLNRNTGNYERDATKAEVDDEKRRGPPLFAGPSVQHLSELMDHVARRMTAMERHRMGQRARWTMMRYYGRTQVAEVVLKRLVELYQKEHSSSVSSPPTNPPK